MTLQEFIEAYNRNIDWNNDILMSINPEIRENQYVKNIIDGYLSTEKINDETCDLYSNFEIFECDNIESLNKQLSIYFTFLLNKQIFIFSNDILWKEYNKFLKLHIIKDLKDIKHNFLTNNIIKHFLGNVFYKNEINEYVMI